MMLTETPPRAPVQHQVACRHLIAVAKKKGLTSRSNLPAWYKRCIHPRIHPGFFMDAYVNVLRHSGVMLVDMDSLVVNPNHIANDPDRTPGRHNVSTCSRLL